MFKSASSFNQTLDGWDVSSGTYFVSSAESFLESDDSICFPSFLDRISPTDSLVSLQLAAVFHVRVCQLVQQTPQRLGCVEWNLFRK